MKEAYDIDYARIRELIQQIVHDYPRARQEVYEDACNTRSFAPNDGMVIGLNANHWFHKTISGALLFTNEDKGIRCRILKDRGTHIFIIEGPDWYYNLKFESAISRQRHGSSMSRTLFHTQHGSTFPMGTEKECANLVLYYHRDKNGILRFDLARTTRPGKYYYDRSVVSLELRYKSGYDEGLPFIEPVQPVSPIPRTTIGQRIAANNDADH